MPSDAEPRGAILAATDIRQIEGSWTAPTQYESLIEDNADLEFRMKLSGRTNASDSDGSTLVVVASADATVTPSEGEPSSTQQPQQALHVRAAFAVTIELGTPGDSGVEIDAEPSAEVRHCALRAAYPLLYQEISRGFRLSGYPPPDMPLTYDEYGDQAQGVET